MIRELHAILAELARRRQQQRLHGGLAVTWWLGLIAGIFLWRSGVPLGSMAAWLVPLLGFASAGVWWWSRSGLGNPREIAKLVETKHPELRTALLAALDQHPEGGTFNYLQLRLLVESVAAAERDEWLELVPQPRLGKLRALNLSGIALLVLALILAMRPAVSHVVGKPAALNASNSAPLEIAVEPGDIEIERGSPLTVQARFGTSVPAEATIETTDEGGQIRSLAMTRPFTEPVFQARLTAVPGPMEYRIVTAAGSSPSFKVRVFDLPALVSSQAVLTFPEHLAKPVETIKDPRAIQVPERTAIALSFTANLPGLSATLNAKGKEPLKLNADPANPARYGIDITPKESIRYELVLTDSAGRRNSRKDLLDIKVLPNKAPVVKVVLPRKNEKATPIQEVRLEAKITDDTGLLAQGLRYTIDGEKWHELETPLAAAGKLPPLSELIDLEAAGAKPKDILMWNAWAEDMGPDGKKRRVNGDIHIVRVRDFDEIYRQQAAPPGGDQEQQQQAGEQGQQAGGAADLIKTETQLLNATWAIRRDHAEISDSPPNAEELETLRRSQEMVIETATAVEAEQTNPSVRQHITDARLAMKDALSDLTKAKEQTSAGPLEEAITHEQVALRHLYQLMSSETMVMTGKNASQQSSSASEEMQRDELELERKETPYQAERQARPETPAGEAAQAMDTLRKLEELAKRQRDLNEEIQALQNALADAKTPEQRAEVERQLKQLREQQREMLADVDQLREQTNDPARDAAQQPRSEALDEAREQAQRASEKLSENKLGEALAEGRRTQESLEEVHDDFRQNSAAQLAEELRDLRKDARALEERQKQLAESDEPAEAPRAPRLREPDAATPQIAQQREELQKLMENVRDTAQSAERAEPLVSKDLSEALRGAEQNQIARSLEQMEQSGGKSPAADRAAEGISNLTREIEGAAGRVLGDEAQALRYARDQLQQLAEQAGGEAPQNPGERQPGEQPGQGQRGEQAGNQPGQGQQPGQQPGQGQPGEQAGNQPGQGQQQGQQPGQGQPGEQAGNQPGQGQQQGQQPGQGQRGEQAGNQPGQGQQQGQQPGQGQPGEQAGNQPGQGQQQGQQLGQGQRGEQAGNQQEQGQQQGQQPGQGQRGEQAGNQPGQQSGQGQRGEQAGNQPGQNSRVNRGGASGGSDGRGGSRNNAITGSNFQEWSERLADLETLVEDPEAQAAVARARQAGREMRRDFTRHSVEPGQDKLNKEVVRPLAEAARKIDARLRELDRKDPLAPVGRDPVPERYDEVVRRYFEELGK